MVICKHTAFVIEVTSLLLCYLPQPLAHDRLQELPGRDLAQDFSVTVCKDGISVASCAEIRKWSISYRYLSSFGITA